MSTYKPKRTRGEKLRKKLSQSEFELAQGVIQGMYGYQAYMLAHPTASESTAKKAAYRVVNRPHVQDYIDYMRSRIEQYQVVSRKEKRRVLAKIIRDDEAANAEKMQAIKIDNQMTGDDAPIKIEAELSLTSIINSLGSTTGLPAESTALPLDDDDHNCDSKEDEDND